MPVGFQLIAKTEHYLDKKTQKQKRRSPTSKHQYCRELIQKAVENQIPFRFVLFDIWFASAENMMFIKHDQQRDFICPLKGNRKVALSLSEKQQGLFQGLCRRVDTLSLEANTTQEIYLEGVDFPLLLAEQVFTNEEGSTGVAYLMCSDTTLSFPEF